MAQRAFHQQSPPVLQMVKPSIILTHNLTEIVSIDIFNVQWYKCPVGNPDGRSFILVWEIWYSKAVA